MRIAGPDAEGRPTTVTTRGGRPAERTLVPMALLLGLGVAWMDSRPGFDATGITVVLLLTGTLAVAAVSGRRPWLWAMLIGAWTPILEIGGGGSPASLAALVIAGVGAAIGYLIARLVR